MINDLARTRTVGWVLRRTCELWFSKQSEVSQGIAVGKAAVRCSESCCRCVVTCAACTLSAPRLSSLMSSWSHARSLAAATHSSAIAACTSLRLSLSPRMALMAPSNFAMVSFCCVWSLEQSILCPTSPLPRLHLAELRVHPLRSTPHPSSFTQPQLPRETDSLLRCRPVRDIATWSFSVGCTLT